MISKQAAAFPSSAFAPHAPNTAAAKNSKMANTNSTLCHFTLSTHLFSFTFTNSKLAIHYKKSMIPDLLT
jgi:hypothetical protein